MKFPTKKFKDLFVFLRKSKFKASEGKNDGMFKFFTSSNIQKKMINKAIYECEAIVFGTGGKASIHYVNDKFSTSADCIVAEVKNKNELLIKFVYYYFQTNLYLLENGFRGAGLKHITKKYINNLEIPILSISLQKRIISLMDLFQKIIHLREKSFIKLKKIEQSIFEKIFGNLILNSMNWDYKKFDTQFKSIRYGTSTPPHFEESGIPFIRATNIKEGKILSKNMKYINLNSAKKIEKCKLKYGDIIIVRSGVNTGDCAMVSKKFDNSYAAYDLIIDIDPIDANFYTCLFNTDYGKKILEPLTKRAAQPHLNSSQLKNLMVPTPPFFLKEKFFKLKNIIDKQNKIYHKNLDFLKQLNFSLNDQYLNFNK